MMSALTTFWLTMLALMGVGPNLDAPAAGPGAAPPPCGTCTGGSEDEAVDWVEIQRRLIRNGKDSIFNGV